MNSCATFGRLTTKHRQLFLFALIVLLSALPAAAANFTVKAGGGGNFTTIQACANAAVGGDTCTVFAGTYAERPTLPHSGTAGNPITFSVNSGDPVVVQGFVITSHSFITIGGPTAATSFQITSASSGNIRLQSTDHIIIQNNSIHAGGARCID